ncbi:MAG TPA: dihydroneopterin aldolase [Candidatus Fimivicinus intestinavium]|nr:dihydroneopterin aldolase [Candidatus Fimivicinus intestinavium]
MDKILIRGLRVFAFHGVNPEEKEEGQLFVVDLTACLDLRGACNTDRLENTVSYAKIIKTVRRVLQADKNDLLEFTAQRIIDAVFAEYPPVQQLTVVLKKPDAPIRADFDYVAVELSRGRKQD